MTLLSKEEKPLARQRGLGEQVSQAQLLSCPDPIHPGTPAAFLHHGGTTDQTQLLSPGTVSHLALKPSALEVLETKQGSQKADYPSHLRGLVHHSGVPSPAVSYQKELPPPAALLPCFPSSKVRDKKIQWNISGNLYSRGEANIPRITSWHK